MEETLIGLIFQNPEIWDKKSNQYKNKKLVDETWNQIAHILKKTKEQAKAKWKNLQTHYTKELSNRPKNKSGDAASTRKTWCHFDAMSFLKENVFKESSGNTNFLNELKPKFDDMKNDRKLDQANLGASTSNAFNSEMTFNEQLQDPENNSEWLFLLSALSMMDKIVGENKKIQFRIEAYCLLYNFKTNNKVAKQGVNKVDEDKKIDKVMNPCAKKLMCIPVKEESNTKEATRQEIRKDNSKAKQVLHAKSIKQLSKKRMHKEVIEIEPSMDVKNWLQNNPLVLKQEEPE